MRMECEDIASFLVKWNKPGLRKVWGVWFFYFFILELVGFNYLVYLQLNLNK